AFAQYPPPGGSVICQGTISVPQTGSTFTVIAQVTDTAGNPLANQTVLFQIISQPGTSAYLTSRSGVTDASGNASTTPFTRPTPGRSVVRCSAPRTSVIVAPPPPPPPSIVIVPPPPVVIPPPSVVVQPAPVVVVPSGQVVAQVQGVRQFSPPSTGD